MAPERASEGALKAAIVARLSDDLKPDSARDFLVLAALDGPEALTGYLESHAEPPRPKASATAAEPAREPMGAYLKSVTVEGFRGIGQKKTLDLPPGPGLTLVVGRNGSGKSSFAEALELLVTGDTYRWAKRAKVWRDGWRNLHHPTAALEAEFLVEGEKGSTRIATAWKDDADVAGAETYAQIHGKPRMDRALLGWGQALVTYRPFLTYNELGSMLDDGPSKLFDALSAILGLEELTGAQETLAEARKARERAYKEAGQKREEVLGLLRPMDDDRARALVAALEIATGEIRRQANAELERREDRWKPIAPALVAWLDQAQKAQQGQEAVKPLKAAEAWLKDAAAQIRAERFAPVSERTHQVWDQLRLQSNVSLQDIQFSGSATKRQVDLKVKVDDVEGAALGVMSQGEQNALALSLFIPRATLPESPFRFVVIDDPVQSMDPSRIDGLARVLHETAGKRQVVVFTHDDRLPEAVRRLGIPATVIEVTRREGSVVDLRPAQDPISRYLDDARAVAKSDGLPPPAARRVIPGLCRLAIDAACSEAIRRRRLGRGEPHAEVEDVLAGVQGSWNLAALALFDDEKRGGEVIGHLNKKGKQYADTFRAVNEGSHEGLSGPMDDLIYGAKGLAALLQKLP